MARRLLSHLLISLAILSLTATFFIWMFDATVLNPTRLSKALQDGGVPSAVASLIPEKAASGEKDECKNASPTQVQPDSCNQPKSEQEKADEADMKAKIAAVVTPDYVHQKIQSAATSVIGYMKNGSPQPIIDISDFPSKLRASGVDVGNDIDDSFSKPIELNKDGALDKLPGYYKTLKLAKYAGVVLFIALLTAEWFVTEKGQKLRRTGRIFLHAAFWYTLWWVVLVVVPMRALPVLKEKAGVTGSEETLVDAAVKSIQHLFGNFLLSFAIVCGIFALAFYLARHGRKHVEKIQAVPDAKTKSTAKSVPNKR